MPITGNRLLVKILRRFLLQAMEVQTALKVKFYARKSSEAKMGAIGAGSRL
jgi:hypothetical protein